ncbi:MAG TPA: hypothetical protein VNO26_07210, partial [Candidatus Limnocylindria bacterium]|nr:hypothetical protein [Candidatus Limnocylindria bacterium]
LAAAGAAAIAGVLGLRRLWPARMVAASASVTALALVVAVVLAMPALQAYLAALALGVLVAPCAVTCARAAFGVPDAERGRWRWSSHVIALVVAGAALGVARLDVRLDIAGYGLRYLPSPARDDLAAMARYLPPPQSFAIRVRGEPGFVTRPDVLGAFARITAAAREDPAVRAASSLADLVARVHRVFNDDRPELERVPDDRALIGRYLALAYSPGFRRFVDRPLATAAIWVDLDSTAPSDALRVHRLLTDALAAHPVPQATVDPPAGDAMALVRSMRAVVALARAGVGVLALSAIGLVPLLGAIGAAHALAVAALSTAAAAGCLGWVGGALDLVTVPGLLAVAVAGLLGGAVTAAGRRAEIGAGRKAV